MKSSQYTTIIAWGTRTRFTLSLFKSKSAAALTKYLFFKMAKTFFTSLSLLRFYLDFRTLAPKYSLIYPTIFYMQYDSYSALVGWFIWVRLGLFGDAHGWGGQKRTPSLKSVTYIVQYVWQIVHIDDVSIHILIHILYIWMKLGTVIPYLNKTQKIYESRDMPLDFYWNHFSLREINKFCYIEKYRYRLSFDT